MTLRCSGTQTVPWGLVVALAIAVSGPGSSDDARAAPAAAFPATFTVRLDASGRGTFTARGGLVDAGRAQGRRAVANGRLNATTTLSGAKGRIVLTTQQPCGRGTGSWRVVSGTRAYAGITGNGTFTARAGCARPFERAAVVYRGTVEIPLLALAKPGPWGGSTARDSTLTFTVTPDGRAIADVLIGTYQYECVRSDGLRMPATSDDRVAAGPFAIAEDRTFSLTSGFATVKGRFTPSRAEGTISFSISYPADPQGRTVACSGSIPWSASTPPPPPRRALAGKYCGFAREGEGVCLEVLDGGREVRNLDIGLFLDCNDSTFYGRFRSAGPVQLQTDLSFRTGSTMRIVDRPGTADLGSASAYLWGTFDQSGAMNGLLRVEQPSFTSEGTRYTCRNSNATFTARLQR